jgi:hypothetical protein
MKQRYLAEKLVTDKPSSSVIWYRSSVIGNERSKNAFIIENECFSSNINKE